MRDAELVEILQSAIQAAIVMADKKRMGARELAALRKHLREALHH